MTFLLNPYAHGAGSAAVPTTLDSGDKTSTITLSNGDLTATKDATSGSAFVFARHGKATGKWRFQVTVDTTAVEITIGISGAMFTGAYPGVNTNSIGLNHGGGGGSGAGVVTNATTQYGSGTTLPNGTVVDVYADLDAGKVWFAKDGTILNGDPEAGTGGTSMGAMRKVWQPTAWLHGANAVLTFNFGATAFTYTGESGFNAWSETTPAATVTQFRTIVMHVRSAGFFSHSFAEWGVMTSSGGANILTGGTPGASHGTASGSVLASGFDGNTTTWVAIAPSGTGTQNQTPGWFDYDFGSDGTRNATHLAIRGRDGGGGAEKQAPTLFDIYVSADDTIFYKYDTGYTFNAFAATTPGERQELTL